MKRVIPRTARRLFCHVGLLLSILLWLNPGHSFSQTTTSSAEGIGITGRVTSQEDGQSVPGVTVLVKNSATGSITDADGNYAVNAPGDGTLVFSSVGFVIQEVSVNSRQVIDVVLAADISTLEEVVVTGYSSQRKKDITGSVSVVDVNEMKSVPSRSAEQALQGMASGVNVTKSGVPGAGSKIFIRGVTNFGNTDPLIIVDGIQQNLNNISAQDIESIQVLKDAGSAAIYGVRGANGVILVTTKKGKTGTPVVRYDATYGTAYPLPGNPFNVLNSQEYMSVYNVAFPNNDRFINGMPDYMYRGPSGAGVAFEGNPAIDPSRYFYASPNRGQNYIIQKIN